LLLRQYLALIRLPNVFTAPPNVLAGYFSVISPADVNGVHLAGLMVSSALLYISGIVFNDYFDIESDKKEHPARPLASGKVGKNHAVVLAVSALAGANIVSLVTVGPGSLAVSAAISAVIIAYDYRLRINAITGLVAMSAARFLNVVLGASPMFLVSLGDTPALTNLPMLMLASVSIFVYTAGIMTLSRTEVVGASRRQRITAFAIVFSVMASVGVFGYVLHFQLEFLLFLSAFGGVMALTFRHYLGATGAMAPPDSTQKTIRNMVLSIILLDSVLVSGTAGMLFGLATLLFILPAAILGKKMYVT